MSGERNSDILWPKSGKLNVSDAEILRNMISRVDLDEAPPLTPDSIYAAFLEAKKVSDAWIKYYFISVTLLIITAARATPELSLFGTKISGQFIGPTAILSFSVCTLAYTNNELKMRLFCAFFDDMLVAKDGPNRASVLLRYPLAFYGSAYLPFQARPADVTVGYRHIAASIPALIFTYIGWLLAVYGMIALLGYASYSVYAESGLPLAIKIAVFTGLFGSLIVSGTLLRKPNARHVYKGGD